VKTLNGNILSDEILEQADAICIPTNGVIKKDKTAVMGAGLAKQALIKWPLLGKLLGLHLRMNGNTLVPLLASGDCWILNFPTKTNWKDPSSLVLIKESAQSLLEYTDRFEWSNVFLPPVGCGLGGLSIDVVKPLLDELLDDRFTLINFG
jgi:hypothetical protein